MKKNSKNPLIIGIAAAVVVLAALLAVLLVQCGGQGGSDQAAPTTQGTQEIEAYQLYYNVDMKEYAGKSEAGLSSRTQESDGYFHVRFFLDGQMVTLKVADRKVVNAIDAYEIMGLEMDENGIVVGVTPPEDMPLEMIGWMFYVQSAGRGMIKLNSSQNLDGMEILLEDIDPSKVWDMTGRSGDVGCVAEAIQMDRTIVISDLGGTVTHVFLVDRANYMATHEGYCLHCDKNVTWSEWVRTDAAPLSAGHYQLHTDVQLKGQASMLEDAKICLDLNGHRIDGKEGARLYSIHNPGGTLAIMDTSADQSGVIAAHGKTSAGGSCLWSRYGALYLYSGTVDASDVITTGNGAAVYVPKNSFFYMHGGTIKGGTANYTHNPDKNTYGAGLGGNVFVAGKFVLYDGLITGGDAKGATYYKNGVKTISRGYGGNVYLNGSAEFEMHGGTIENGRAGTSGANLCASGTSTVTIHGGAIKGGRITGTGKNGGSVFLATKTVANMRGGSITGGVSYNGGGNVYTNGRFNMTGGYIGGGVCYSADTGKRNPNSPNYNLMMVNGRFAMYGGTIAGGVSVTDSKAGDNLQTHVTLSGYAKIDGGPNGRNLYLSASGDGIKTVVGKLYERAKIGVYTTTGLFTEPTLEAYQKNFYSDIKGAEVVYYNERLGLGRLQCVCGKEDHKTGCDGQIHLWAPWLSATAVPKTTGSFYLLQDVTTTSQSTVTTGNHVKLDLNGHNVTLAVKPSAIDGFRLYRADRDASLTLTDTTGKPGTLKTVMPGEDAVYPGTTTNTAKSEKDENGKIINRVYYTEDEMRQIWAAANSGMLLWVRGGEISVHNGIYDGSALTGAKNGMTVYVGNVTETDAETGAKTTYYGTFNLYGGTIVGGYTEANGNIAVIAGATMNIYGGTVKDGRSYKGGNLYVEGTLNMQGGTVSGGKVDRSKENVDGGQGGNIWLDTKAVMNLSGGTVKNGFVRGGKNGGGQGGNIFVGGVLNGTGGTISGGDATAGGNIGTISADSAITLKKVKVLDGQADAGGNILIGVRSNKALELMEGTVISGGHARSAEKGGNGGNIAVNLSSNVRDQEQVILIDGATITGGTSVGTGGNIRIRNLSEDKFDENGNQTHRRVNVKIVMRGGTISGGKNDSANRTDSTRQNGGSVYQSEYSQFILEGGTVTGGDCSDGGGNFYLTENSTLELRGGSITGGLRNGEGHAASNIFVVGGTLKLSGGKVDGNVAVSGSSDVILSGKAVVSKGSHGGITLRNGNLISIDGTLAAGSEVYTSGAGYVSKTVAAGNEAYIHSVDGYPSNHVDGRIFYGKVSCLCSSTNHTEGCKAAMAALGLGENDKLPMLPVTAASDMADGGYWYLPKSITSGANVYIPDNKPLVLDLNGNTLTADHNSFLFSTQKAENGALLVVTDTEGEGGVTLTSSKDTTAQGGILRVSGKSGKDVCYVLGGRLDASGYRLTTGKLGGVVAYVTNGCTLKQYGGTFVGRDSGTAIGAGSTVHVKQGAYELLGGAVEGGTAKNGGNVYVDTAASFTMSGGSITGGKADEGSNLYILGTATLRGGELSGVYVGSDSVTVTGNATVAKGSTYGLKVENGKTVNVTGLTGTVSVTGTAGRAFARGGSAAQAETNLRSELGGSPVMFYEADYLYLGKAVDIYCVCGATLHGHKCQDNGTLHRWSDWTATDTLPSESGYYRLTDTVNVDGSKTATLTGQTIYLDLNGQTVNLENGENLYNFTEAAGAKLIITDSSEKATGIAKLTGTNSANGGFADILAGNTVELYRATLDASQFSTKENGAALAVRGTFHMHSGAVVGGKAVETKKNGGTLWLAKGSQLTLDGGTVTGGEAGRWGGAIYVTGSGTLFTMNGGTVTGGKAAENGGVIIVRDNAVMNMKNGTITGSNLFVDGTGVFTMTGGSVADMEVNGNKATVTGGATVAAMTINSGKVVDMKGLTGTVTVISQPGQVFAAGTAEQINVNILSQVTVQGFKLPILVKDTDQLYLDAAEAVHCICGASLHGHKCQDDGKLYYWQPWTETSTLPSASGYYRLTGTVNVSSVVTLANGETIYLDLNGQKVNLEDKENLYSITEGKNVRVVVTDSSKDATGAVKLTGSDTANGGIAEILTGNTLEVYRATFDASGFTLENNGTVFSVKGGTCVIHSGKLIGGKAQNGKNQKNGGTLWVVTGAQVTMKDGTIVGGYADKWAGAVYASDANTLFKLEGGTIEGGSAQMLGGNVVARNGATFHMTGGTVTGGSVVTGGEGANVYVYGDANNKNQGTFKMEGGTVTGGVYVSNAKEVTITGSAIIDASLTKAPYTAPAYGLKVENGRTVNVAGLTGKVCVSAEPGTCFATGATAAQANVNVLSETRLDDTDLKVLFVDGGKLHMGTVYCICGASLHGHKCQDDGTKYLWTDWTAADTLPSDSGYYRLTGTVNVSGTVTLANGETIYLDLNGQTVNLENGENLYTFTANKNVRVVVTDSSKNATGTVKLTGTHTANGGITEVTAGNTLELYRATLDASTFTTAQNGGTLAVRGELIIHSGTLKGGTVRGLNSEAKKKNGGTLWVSGGKVTMHDGLIIGGNADNMAGAIYLAGTAQFLMENGTITGGYGANGGGHSPIPGHNIQINSADAIMRITGGTITGGVHLNKIKEVTITNGAIIDKSLTDSAYTMPEHSLSINKAYSVNVADLTGTVYVTATEDAVFATGATAAQAEKNVLSEVTGTKVVLTDSTKLKLTAN